MLEVRRPSTPGELTERLSSSRASPSLHYHSNTHTDSRWDAGIVKERPVLPERGQALLRPSPPGRRKMTHSDTFPPPAGKVPWALRGRSGVCGRLTGCRLKMSRPLTAYILSSARGNGMLVITRSSFPCDVHARTMDERFNMSTHLPYQSNPTDRLAICEFEVQAQIQAEITWLSSAVKAQDELLCRP